MCGCCRLVREHRNLFGDLLIEVAGPRLVKPVDFERASMYAVFTGPAKETGIGDRWDLFGVEGTVATDEVVDEAARRGVTVAFDECGHPFEPQWDQDRLTVDDEHADDFQAACAYLNSGGRLVKLPDAPSSRYFRLYAIVDARQRSDKHVAEDAG
jgi:hypothetical protein